DLVQRGLRPILGAQSRVAFLAGGGVCHGGSLPYGSNGKSMRAVMGAALRCVDRRRNGYPYLGVWCPRALIESTGASDERRRSFPVVVVRRDVRLLPPHAA